MIFYFSGTGNSKFVATSVATLTEDVAVSITGVNPLECNLSKEKQVGFVFPIYAWAVPSIMKTFMNAITIPKDIYTYVVCTCGLDCGTSLDKLKDELNLNAAISIQMPDNYVIGSSPKSLDENRVRVKSATKKIKQFSDVVNSKGTYFDYNKGKLPIVKSSVVNFAFKKFVTSDKSFFVDDDCNSCGACEKICQINNIKIVDGKPIWKGNCIQCLACINRCPQQAIQYTNVTRDRGRYFFTDDLLK